MQEFNLSDQVIAQVAKLVQVAILSGTDIVDHMRQVRLVADGETLNLSEGYQQQFDDNISTMLEEVSV